MQTLKFIGRGSAFNTQEDNTSAYIKDGKSLLLIDCGESIFQKIIETKLLDDVKDIAVLITHLNSDHVASLSSLIFYCYYVKKIKINVYFPNNELLDLLRIMGNTEEQCNLYSATESVSYVENNIYFKFIPTTHIKGMNCYGISIVYNDKTIYYSGDSNIIPISINNQLNIIDELYQDTCLAYYEGNVHLSLRKLCELIPNEYRNKVYCMHLDCNELITKARKEGFDVVEVEN